MKPVKLTFSGLQSYREEQEINFEELGRLGIFGVFGPTGAGKSTLLDAITLALYGKVERAKGGTRGILNQFENRLSVSFEFTLGNKRYLAERLYTRGKQDPDSVLNKNARLVELVPGSDEPGPSDELSEPGQIVLADKASDVDRVVIDLLGMSFEDFSRAVILPQGKFDQFLKLTGNDRARMLENILRLERYGEDLSRKARNLEIGLSNRLRTNQELTLQLGDASENAVKAAEKALKDQGKLVKEKDTARKKAEAALKEIEQVATLYDEIEALERERETLAAEKPDVERDRQTLDRAQKAEPLRNLVAQVETLAKKEAEEAARLKEQEEKAQKTAALAKTAGERMNKAKEGEEELKNLTERELPNAKLALEFAKQRARLEEEKISAEKAISDNTTALEKIAREGKEKNAALTKVKEDILALHKKRRELEKLTNYRAEIETALAAETELTNAEKAHWEARLALKAQEEKLKEEEARLRQLLNEHINASEIEGKEFSELPALVDAVVQKAAEEKKEADRLLQEAILQNMAGALAQKLTEGEPCPVCGSTHHPNPAAHKEEDAAQKVEDAAEDVAEAADTPAPTPVDPAIAAAQEAADRAADRLALINAWQQQANLIFHTCANITKEIEELYRPAVEEKGALRPPAQQAFNTATMAVEDAKLEWNDLKGLKLTLDRAERENRELIKKMEALEETARTIERERTELRVTYADLKKEGEGQARELKRLAREAEGHLTKITAITGGKDPAEYAREVRNRVDALQKEQAEAREAWEAAQREEQEAGKLLAVLGATLEKTREHRSEVERDLTQNMAREGFTGIGEVKSALLDPAAQKNLRQKLDEYEKALDRNAKAMKDKEEKIKSLEKTKDCPYTMEQLEEARLTLETAAEEYKYAVSEEGALRNRLEDLRQKQARWQELKEEYTKLTRRRELAARLVNLLKGRKFVQFLAEEHLRDMAAEASVRLAALTGQRYALELDEDCNFVMRDDYSGSQRRPVNTLSGGETFLTSLSLALALSSKIQLKGQYPLGFFFLDEGFGTLDPEKLEVVMNTLEKLHDGHRMVGVITHVPELRSRMPRYLEVEAARADGSGSRVKSSN